MAEDEEAIQTDEKCGDMPEYKPFGGATSFADIDAQKAISEYAMNVEMETEALRGIIMNITNSDDFNTEEKAAAISDAASNYKKRVDAIQNDAKAAQKSGGFLSWIKRNISTEERNSASESDFAGPNRSFPILKAADVSAALHSLGRTKGDRDAIRRKIISIAKRKGFPLPESVQEDSKKEIDNDWNPLPENRGFKVYRDKAGDLRWLSLSSNAFEDLDKELFTTKALEEAIEYGDKTGERGPLLVYHVPSAIIGQCDYQAMAGRFLVESGTFDNTPLGKKAVEYFVNSDEEHQVSIGYQYLKGDELDGVYDWTRIIERSVIPHGAAANPWTDFKVIGENLMDERKAATLEKIFGKELSDQVIASAEARTKELEESVRFKAKEAEDAKEAEAKAEADKAAAIPTKKAEANDDEGDDADGKKKPPPFAKKEGEDKAAEGDAIALDKTKTTELIALLTDLSAEIEGLSGLKTIVEELQSQVKELKKSEDERLAEIMTPRWSLPGGVRPSESEKNLVKDEKDIEDVVKAGEGDGGDKSTNPAQAYIDDILGRPRIAVS